MKLTNNYKPIDWDCVAKYEDIFYRSISGGLAGTTESYILLGQLFREKERELFCGLTRSLIARHLDYGRLFAELMLEWLDNQEPEIAL